jgi:TRAP-type mannitol/chloroaromatic compound transport system permease large subunit
LFHTNFLPTFIQVNFFPPAIVVLAIFLHGDPAETAAVACRGAAIIARASRTVNFDRTA